jgi:hypothetical protein
MKKITIRAQNGSVEGPADQLLTNLPKCLRKLKSNWRPTVQENKKRGAIANLNNK